MFDRILTLAAGVAALVLVAAQIVAPAWTFVHGEPYALVLGALLWVLLAYVLRAWRGADGRTGTRLAISAAGAALIALTGLASGLLGADTSTIARAPGTVVPLPDIGAAAFFPLVDASGIGRGDARVVLRMRGAAHAQHDARVAAPDAARVDQREERRGADVGQRHHRSGRPRDRRRIGAEQAGGEAGEGDERRAGRGDREPRTRPAVGATPRAQHVREQHPEQRAEDERVRLAMDERPGGRDDLRGHQHESGDARRER